MPPLRPPGVGEPTVPMTRSASAERVFRFRCRGFDLPPVSMPPSVVRVRPFAVRACSFLCSPCLPAPCCPRPSPCCPCPPAPCCPRRPSPCCPRRPFPCCPCRPSPCSPCRPSVPLLRVADPAVSGAEASGRRLRCVCRSFGSSPRGSIYIGAAENSNGSTTERRLDRQKPGFCGTAGCAGCRSRTGALSSRRRYFCGKLL